MGLVSATVMDAADIRAFDCRLPDDVKVSVVALRLAELTRMPIIGPDGRPVVYGLIIKGGELLDPDATLAQLDLLAPLTLRLVPEVEVGAGDGPLFTESAAEDEDDESEIIHIEVGEQRALLHDTVTSRRPDVRIDAAVHCEIGRFAGEDRYTECAGLLLGKVDVEDGQRVMHITAIAPASEAVGSRANVKLTLDAWESMLRIRDLEYSDLRVLGWFHTHAGWGVFLSDADVFVQRHFFPHPNMVAYVLDPTIGRDGFFYWHEGKLSLCPNYGLVGASQEVQPRRRRSKPTRGRPDLRDIVIGALVVLVLYFVFMRTFAVDRVPAKQVAPPAAKQVVPAAPAASVAKPSAGDKDRIHRLGHGESLWHVANRVYGNGDLAKPLAKYNNLDDIGGLQIGQELRLPPKEVLERDYE